MLIDTNAFQIFPAAHFPRTVSIPPAYKIAASSVAATVGDLVSAVNGRELREGETADVVMRNFDESGGARTESLLLVLHVW